MSVRQNLLRYIHVLNKLRMAPASFIEIDDFLKRQSELQGEKLHVSKRQFRRSLDDIESIFEVSIDYDVIRDVYYINEDHKSEISQRRMEAFDTFNALKIGDDTARYIYFERRHPQGTENLLGLLHAIKSQMQVRFTYQKFWEDNPTQRLAEPFALKEFKYRWYLIAKDQKDGTIKTFALDRLSGFEITHASFVQLKGFNVETYFKHCFGIINPNSGNPEEIVLSFTPHHGKYIKTLPLHESQQVLIDSTNELRIQLKLFPTIDFLLEILSHGDQVKVISPESLVKQIRKNYQNTLDQYHL